MRWGVSGLDPVWVFGALFFLVCASQVRLAGVGLFQTEGGYLEHMEYILGVLVGKILRAYELASMIQMI